MLYHNQECPNPLTIKNFLPFDIIPVFGMSGKNLTITQVTIQEKKKSSIKNPEFICTKCNQRVYIPHIQCRECGKIKAMSECVVLSEHGLLMCSACHSRYYSSHKAEKITLASISI